uniref:hypothetical protein n=1 Tax=Litorimonas sp. TaxID=1892381 RepID=UPI003A8770C3
MSDTDEAGEAGEARKRFGDNESWLLRICEQVMVANRDVMDPDAPDMDDIEEFFNLVSKEARQFDDYSKALKAAEAADINRSKNKARWEKRFVEAQAAHRAARQTVRQVRAMMVAKDIELPSRDLAPPPRPPDVYGDGHREPQWRSQDSLKPDKLEVDTNPVARAGWEVKMKAYYVASKFDKIDFPTSLPFIYACLSDDLAKRVRDNITDNVYGVPPESYKEMMLVIVKEHGQSWPLDARRVAFFNVDQEVGEEWIPFYLRTKALMEEGEIDKMNGDQHLAMALRLKTNDKRLREKFEECSNKDHPRQLYVVATEYKAFLETEKIVSKNKSVASVAVNAIAKQEEERRFDDRECFRCGKQGHVK